MLTVLVSSVFYAKLVSEFTCMLACITCINTLVYVVFAKLINKGEVMQEFEYRGA